jgi:FlaA1/EpsC-like NDP-sugar epimerase
MRVLVTGAAGSVGTHLVPRLESLGYTVKGIDREWDITRPSFLRFVFEEAKPQVVIHLAAAKSAPDGELFPLEIADTNVTGTTNVLRAARDVGARVILASTCKAADPETAYGASKLLCERMVLSQLGSVARFFNVREAGGNVFRLWEQVPPAEPLPVTPCRRFFISMVQAVDLLVQAVELPSGRYTVRPDGPFLMRDVAEGLYPGRELSFIMPRRGDRDVEPLCARTERVLEIDGGLLRIESVHDELTTDE